MTYFYFYSDRSTSIQALHRNTFGNGNTFNFSRVRSNPYGRSDELCEFQVRMTRWQETVWSVIQLFYDIFFKAGRSFDLPDKFSSQSRPKRHQQLWRHQHKTNFSATSSHFLPVYDASLDSCHGNLRYQAVESMVQTSRHQGGLAQKQQLNYRQVT